MPISRLPPISRMSPISHLSLTLACRIVKALIENQLVVAGDAYVCRTPTPRASAAPRQGVLFFSRNASFDGIYCFSAPNAIFAAVGARRALASVNGTR